MGVKVLSLRTQVRELCIEICFELSIDKQYAHPLSTDIVVLLGVLLTVVTISLVVVCLLLAMTCYDKKRTHYRRLQSTLEPESA